MTARVVRMVWRSFIVSLVAGAVLPCAVHGTCVDQPPDLVGWWAGDGDAQDLAGSNHGTLHGDASYATGMVDQAFSLDGSDDYVSVPDDAALRAVSEITIDFWAYFNSVPTGAYADSFTIAEKENDYVVYWRADMHRFEIAFNNSAGTSMNVAYSWTPALVAGSWHHFAITGVNGGAVSCYFDGVEQTLGVAYPGAWYTGATGELRIGTRYDGSLDFDGMIDELDVFDRALSHTEIEGIYDAGGDGKCKGTAPDVVFADGFENGATSEWSSAVP